MSEASRGRNTPTGPGQLERPLPSPSDGVWVSDVVAEVLRRLDIPYAALNPGASYRGLHDSLVNHLGNQKPQMLVCLHEEHAVAIAHGWAKVREKPMMAILHSNVGLLHGSMAIFNAWCDRVPMLLLGATGPVDAAKRRPWIDWIHTSKDQGALIRNFIKWDDQPTSAEAAIESLMRAAMITETAPHGPTYVCLDAGLQETKVEQMPAMPMPDRFQAPEASPPSPSLVAQAAARLAAAERPLILAGRVKRGDAEWAARIRLAEALGARVLTDLKVAAAFPTNHRLHGAPAGYFNTEAGLDLVRKADVILSLDWVDLGGTLKAAFGGSPPTATVIQASVDQHNHNGWNMDYQVLPPVDLYLLTEPDLAAAALLEVIERHGLRNRTAWAGYKPVPPDPAPATDGSAITVRSLAATLRDVTAGQKVTLVRVPSAWTGGLWPFEHPLDYLGYDGGGGLASGPGIAVGAGLALQGTGRLPIAVTGDGDFLMGATAMWTAAHYRIPTLVIVANNRAYYNDEVHQERVANMRGRLPANKWIGQHINDPDIDIAALARSQGVAGFGPVVRPEELREQLAKAVRTVQEGQPAVVDVRVVTGYEASTVRSLVRPAK